MSRSLTAALHVTYNLRDQVISFMSSAKKMINALQPDIEKCRVHPDSETCRVRPDSGTCRIRPDSETWRVHPDNETCRLQTV